MKTILFTKNHGNHTSANANLEFYESFNSYSEAKSELTKIIRSKFNESNVSDFDEFEDEQLNYWAIYSEGDDQYVDDNFFNN